MPKSTYRLRPKIGVETTAESAKGYASLVSLLHGYCVLETYPGFARDSLIEGLRKAGYAGRIALAEDFCSLSAKAFRNHISDDLTSDRVFGKFTNKDYFDYYDREAIADFVSQHEGQVLIIGIGASLFAKSGSKLFYADMLRWDLQLKYRKGTPVFFKGGIEEDALANFKRGYFVE